MGLLGLLVFVGGLVTAPALPTLGVPLGRSVAAGVPATSGSIHPNGWGLAVRAQPLAASYPHPNPIPAHSPAFNGHYYAGAVYTGSNTTSTDLRATVEVPRDSPDPSDFYYVLVSVWDDAGSYDQVGFTSGSGVWGVAYSTTTPCAGSYNFATDAYNLTGGSNYTFEMRISLGSVTFSVSPSGSSPVWSITQATGGGHFVIGEQFVCGGAASLDYTDYEEVYTTVAPVPPYPFNFSANLLDGSPVTTWTAIAGGGGPPPIATAVSQNDVTIENEPFWLGLPAVFPAEVAATPQNFTLRVSVGSFGSGSAVALSEVGAIGTGNDTSFSFRPSSGNAPFLSTLTMTVNPGTPSGSSQAIQILARDSSGVYARLRTLVGVAAPLAANPPVAYPSSVDVNQSMTISEAPTGGAGPFAFTWLGLPSGCSGNASLLTCRPQASGAFHIGVVVVDSLAFSSGSLNLPLMVSPALNAALAANRSSIDIGQDVGFTLTASGGSGGNQVTWQGGGPGCSRSGNLLDCRGVSVGSLSVSAVVTDSNGFLVTANAPKVSVLADPVAALTVDRPTIDLGGAFTLRASASGGAGPILIAWLGLPSDCPGANRTSVTCRTAAPGEFAISIVATDANGFANASRVLVVTVNEPPMVRLAGTSSAILSGDGFSVTATVSGGSGGWRYAWTGLPYECPASNAATISCTPTTAGTFTIRLIASDATGANASDSVTLTVAPSLFGLPEAEGIGLLLITAGVVAVGVGLLLRRRRRRRLRRPPTMAADPGRRAP